MKRGKDGTAAVKKATVAPKAGDSKRFGNIKFKEISVRVGPSQSESGPSRSSRQMTTAVSGFHGSGVGMLFGAFQDLKKLGLLGCGGFGAVEMVAQLKTRCEKM